jgi:hypothetical protein
MSRKSIEERVDELEYGKQDELISGTTIKTINGASILGSGDLAVSGSGAAWGGITGTLSSQTDLQTALNGKASGTGTANGTNTGDQTSIVGITGTKAQFDTAVTDGNFVFVGDAVLNPEGWSVIVKSANQDVTNSTTLVNDTDLQFSVVAGGHYMVEMNLCCSSNNTTGSYRLAFNISSGIMKGSGSLDQYATANSLINSTGIQSTIITLTTPIADIDSLMAIKIRFNFSVDTNTTFKFNFANGAAGAGRISRTWKGSILKYKRLD